MPKLTTRQIDESKTLLKASLAVAGPAIVPLVILISSDPLSMLRIASLGRFGILAMAVLLGMMGFLFFKRRWWAGIPALLILSGGTLVFAWKAFRPLWAYYSVNAFNSPAGGFEPILLVSPSLVIMVLCVFLFWKILAGIRTLLPGKVQPVSYKTWGLLAVWLLVLMGDAAYQEAGWRYFKNPSDLVLRLCLSDDLRDEAGGYLLDMGAKAVPVLLQGTQAPGPNLYCIREQCRDILTRVGPEAKKEIIDLAQSGNVTANEIMQTWTPTRKNLFPSELHNIKAVREL